MTRRFPPELVAVLGAVALAACSEPRPLVIGESAGGCTQCHGQPPETDAHLVHTGGGSLKRSFDCNQCHFKPKSASDPDHILRADGTPVPPPAEVRFDQPGAIAGDTQQGGTRPAGPKFDTASRTCSNVYCHGATLGGQTGNLVLQPAWASKGQVVCGSCHGIPPGDAPHSALTPGDRTACARCHVGAIDAQGKPDPTLHVNGHVDVPTDQGCNRCHGRTDLAEAVPPGDARSAPPNDLLGQSSSTAVGAHQAHLTGTHLRQASIACSDCHVVPTAIIAPGHIDGNVTVPFGTLAQTGGATPSYDFAAHTCSNVYCHGTFRNSGVAAAPAWDGGPAAAACGACHGLPPPVSGGHPDTKTLACGQCHSGYTYDPAAQTGGVNPANHINGRIDF